MEANPEPTLADDEARLAAFAEQLIEQVDTSIGGWVRRSVFAAAGAGGVKVVEGDLAPVIDQTRGAAMPEIRRVLRADAYWRRQPARSVAERRRADDRPP